MAVSAESAQKQRSRGNFGLMVVWAVVGCLLAILLKATFSAAGLGTGFIRSETSEVAMMISAYLVVGIVVLGGIVKAYKEPGPGESIDRPSDPIAEPRRGHLVTRHSLRRQEETRAVEVDRR